MIRATVYSMDGSRVWRGPVSKLVAYSGEYDYAVSDRIQKPQLLVGRQFPGFVVIEPIESTDAG